jgi:oleate hydratase
LDGAGSKDNGYVIRGGRMIEEHYVCTYDLFEGIPSLILPKASKTKFSNLATNTSAYPDAA